ncbi:hypothetical protein Cgig2_000828 [Carnegiea gigantea]|uniref:Uncharacterized protein n=1 Tax=Carnegiea gigantea TaxID=171969 RepID=A0A9Q1KKK6_9CARY|nr:hypothetical protein Cgig2_000828 [Carnegiea gigantea]
MEHYDNIRAKHSISILLGTCEWHDNFDPTWCSSLMDNTLHILDNHILNQLPYALANDHKLEDTLTKPTAHRPSLFLLVKVIGSVACEHLRIVGSALPAHSSENPYLSYISHISSTTSSSSHRWIALIAGSVVQNSHLTRQCQCKNRQVCFPNRHPALKIVSRIFSFRVRCCKIGRLSPNSNQNASNLSILVLAPASEAIVLDDTADDKGCPPVRR